jgi:hypothetical protein
MTETKSNHVRASQRNKDGAAQSGIGAPLNAQDRQMFENICGDFGIKIGFDGTWYYQGTPIGRLPLVKLFSTVLRKDAQGEYWLVTPVEKGRIEVDDVPFIGVELIVEGSGRDQKLKVRTNLDDIVMIGPDHPLRVEVDEESGEPRPYVRVRDNLDARLNRPVFYQLVDLGEESRADGGRVLGVWSAGAHFSIGSLEPGGAPH